MQSYIAALALMGGASAAVLPRQQPGCCFQLTASGGESGQVSQLGDGQNRIHGSGSPATYCLNNGQITDANGRGCILTPPTTQFQCDTGATPSGGFSIGNNGEIEHNGSGTFYACGATDSEYNIYTQPVSGQKDCVEISLSSGGKCAGTGSGNGNGGSGSSAAGSGAASTAPAQSAPAYGQGSSAPAQSAQTSQPKPMTSQPAADTSMPAAETSQPAAATSQPAIHSYGSQQTQPKPMTSQPAAVTSQPAIPSYGSQQTQPKPATSQPKPETSQASAMTSQPAVDTSMPAAETSQPAAATSQPAIPSYGSQQTQPKPMTSQPAVDTSMPAAASSAPGYGSQQTQPKPMTSQPAVDTSMPAAASSAPGYGSQQTQPKPATSQPAPATSQAPAPSMPAGQSSAATQPAGSASAYSATPASGTGATGTQPASSGSASGSACQTSLSGSYQTPHAIIPVSSENKDMAYGTSYNGQINSTTSTIFNFDIPYSYEGKQCSIIFLFPEKKDLETSDYTFSGSGSISFSQLSSAASTGKTSYNTCPAVGQDLGSIAVQPGNSYVVANQPCQAGTTESIELSSEGGLGLNFFEDWNPSSLGLYITSC